MKLIIDILSGKIIYKIDHQLSSSERLRIRPQTACNDLLKKGKSPGPEDTGGSLLELILGDRLPDSKFFKKIDWRIEA